MWPHDVTNGSLIVSTHMGHVMSVSSKPSGNESLLNSSSWVSSVCMDIPANLCLGLPAAPTDHSMPGSNSYTDHVADGAIFGYDSKAQTVRSLTPIHSRCKKQLSFTYVWTGQSSCRLGIGVAQTDSHDYSDSLYASMTGFTL